MSLSPEMPPLDKDRAAAVEQQDASLFGTEQEQASNSRKRRSSVVDSQSKSKKRAGVVMNRADSNNYSDMDLDSEDEFITQPPRENTMRTLMSMSNAAKQMQVQDTMPVRTTMSSASNVQAQAQPWTRQVLTSEYQLQAIRMFETDLSLLNTRLAPDSLFDWSTLVQRSAHLQTQLTNDQILSSLRFWQFPVARAFAEIQHLYRLDVNLATIWYGDTSRTLFIQLAQAFEHECKLCLGVKFINLHSLRAFTDARRKTMAYFYPYSKVAQRGESSQTQEFTLAFDSEQSQSAIQLCARSAPQVRASLFAELLYSANLRPCPAKRLEIKIRQPAGDFEFNSMPDGLGLFVQRACRNVGGFMGLSIQQTLLRLGMQQQIGVAVILIHLALFEACLLRSQSGTNLTKYTLAHLNNMYNISVSMLLQTP